MAQVLVRGLSDEVVEQLKALASRRHRSLEAEVRLILEEVAQRERKREEFWRLADEIRLRSGPQTTDSVDLLREDRER
jgi:plasmid stability protein